MIVVLDASAGIEIVLKRPNSSLFHKVILESKKVISSDLYKIEIADTLWKYIQAELLDKKLNKNCQAKWDRCHWS